MMETTTKRLGRCCTTVAQQSCPMSLTCLELPTTGPQHCCPVICIAGLKVQIWRLRVTSWAPHLYSEAYDLQHHHLIVRHNLLQGHQASRQHTPRTPRSPRYLIPTETHHALLSQASQSLVHSLSTPRQSKGSQLLPVSFTDKEVRCKSKELTAHPLNALSTV